MYRGVLLLVVLPLASCRPSVSRTHETCLKDALFAVQRATRRVAAAEDYEAIGRLETVLKTEAARLRELRTEFEAMAPPSSWERSRMRKHRPLAETTFDAWAAIERDLRERLDGGVPPHLRILLTAALDEFEQARTETWNAISSRWD